MEISAEVSDMLCQSVREMQNYPHHKADCFVSTMKYMPDTKYQTETEERELPLVCAGKEGFAFELFVPTRQI